MEYFGFIALMILLCYSGIPAKIKRLESEIKGLKRSIKGEKNLSKLINELKGKKCVMECDEALVLGGNTKLTCEVIDMDDEWVKIIFDDKKGVTRTKIIRIETIRNIELSVNASDKGIA